MAGGLRDPRQDVTATARIVGYICDSGSSRCKFRPIVNVGKLLSFTVQDGMRVSARFELPARARACYAFAHGAGAGMDHPFMNAVAAELGARGVATLRFQFPYMERGSRRPDPPPLCHATVRAAAAECHRLAAGLPLFAGGRSFGGRMTSQAQAIAPMPGVRGLAFLGFPLHPAGRPSVTRAEHLAQVGIPMLFLQGTRDALAERAHMEAAMARLGARAHIRWLEHADHGFRAPISSGRTEAQLRRLLLDELCSWLEGLL